MVTTKEGNTREPSSSNAGSIIIAGLFAIMLFGFIFSKITSSMSSRSNGPFSTVTIDGKTIDRSHPLSDKYYPRKRKSNGPPMGIIALFFLVIIGGTVLGFINENNKAMDFNSAERAYLAKRKKLLEDLDKQN